MLKLSFLAAFLSFSILIIGRFSFAETAFTSDPESCTYGILRLQSRVLKEDEKKIGVKDQYFKKLINMHEASFSMKAPEEFKKAYKEAKEKIKIAKQSDHYALELKKDTLYGKTFLKLLRSGKDGILKQVLYDGNVDVIYALALIFDKWSVVSKKTFRNQYPSLRNIVLRSEESETIADFTVEAFFLIGKVLNSNADFDSDFVAIIEHTTKTFLTLYSQGYFLAKDVKNAVFVFNKAASSAKVNALLLEQSRKADEMSYEEERMQGAIMEFLNENFREEREEHPWSTLIHEMNGLLE